MHAQDKMQLTRGIQEVHEAGMPGIIAEVRDNNSVWQGAAGFADLATAQPMTSDMRHRVGSISKTFVVAAVLRLVEEGQLSLEASIGDFLPRLVPGERGRAITIRMLMSHTSGLAEYLPSAFSTLSAFPVLADTTPDSLLQHRHTHFSAIDLIGLGVRAPAVGKPGGSPGVYSNTNYLLLCRLIELVTGQSSERFITDRVIRPAGLEDTGFPSSPWIDGPHSRMYESWFGMLDPAVDLSVYDMSWVGPAASLITTVADLNRFYALLLNGEIVTTPSLRQMQRTGPVISFEGTTIQYGLGLHRFDGGSNGTFWGHDGTVWGAGAISMIRDDGARQMSVAVNLMRPNRLDDHGRPQPHPLDAALPRFHRTAMCGAPVDA